MSVFEKFEQNLAVYLRAQKHGEDTPAMASALMTQFKRVMSHEDAPSEHELSPAQKRRIQRMVVSSFEDIEIPLVLFACFLDGLNKKAGESAK
jgi:hypothetical protein